MKARPPEGVAKLLIRNIGEGAGIDQNLPGSHSNGEAERVRMTVTCATRSERPRV